MACSYQNVARLKLHHVHRRLIAPGENMGVLKTKVFLSNWLNFTQQWHGDFIDFDLRHTTEMLFLIFSKLNLNAP